MAVREKSRITRRVLSCRPGVRTTLEQGRRQEGAGSAGLWLLKTTTLLDRQPPITCPSAHLPTCPPAQSRHRMSLPTAVRATTSAHCPVTPAILTRRRHYGVGLPRVPTCATSSSAAVNGRPKHFPCFWRSVRTVDPGAGAHPPSVGAPSGC
ncbi:hypothetical protein CALVIDRAFT_87460 [Calocera viscosa TUFC12733]|uniref:Uncharacterized protein n=1 Tax=Calocera viscosa (strain TUFC12733) TaxID=1330018 RepID=A0A167N6N6_CALVF|nr:hypothetical protein CALVIDRAFT_87460 [Calocera viscosa TUFC12733]